MLIKTHLAITGFFILLFLSVVEYKFVFVIVALFATYLPDIDSPSSKAGNHFVFRPLQFFMKHRGILHSFVFLILVTLFFVLFFPVVAFGFFLGYASHLLADSFTLEGIAPFYPYNIRSCGIVRTGGVRETAVFISFVFVDLFLIGGKVFSIF